MGMEQFARLLAPLRRKIVLSIGRAVITAVNDDTTLQTLQLTALQGEVLDLRERLQEYGFTSRPHPGADAIMVSLGGNRTNTVVVAVDDRRYRMKLQNNGDVALYTSTGNHVVLGVDGTIYIEGTDLYLNASGNLRLEGNTVNIVSWASTTVQCAGHGEVWYSDHKDTYTIGAIAGTTYAIATPEITL